MWKGIEVVEAEGGYAAVMESTLSLADIPAKLMPLVDRVWAFIRAGGVDAHGHNIWIYHLRADGQVDVQIGVQVPRPFVGRDSVVCAETPSGRAARAVHYGPYDQLPSVHSTLRAWCTERGLDITGDRWELYGDHDPDPAKCRTDVYHGVK